MMISAKKMITVIKQNVSGEETWRYQGAIIDQTAEKIVIEAFFDREDSEFHGIWLRMGDRFVETYFSERWYNIFEIFDVHDKLPKGWYCNIATPAVLDGDKISYRDLALDLLVYPNGRQLVLDEDEFEALALPEKMVNQAKKSLAELQALFDSGSFSAEK